MNRFCAALFLTVLALPAAAGEIETAASALCESRHGKDYVLRRTCYEEQLRAAVRFTEAWAQHPETSEPSMIFARCMASSETFSGVTDFVIAEACAAEQVAAWKAIQTQ